MSSNAKVRRHEKRNENRTGKETNKRWHRMNAYAHPRSHRERKVCPYVRARNAARSSPPRTSKMV